ncbi:hypothetical protein GCM10019814_06100 [Lactococcus raffinolactis]|jgi:hypothetical protein
MKKLQISAILFFLIKANISLLYHLLEKYRVAGYKKSDKQSCHLSQILIELS